MQIEKIRSLISQYILLCLAIVWFLYATYIFWPTISQFLDDKTKDLAHGRDLGLIILGPFITLLTLHFTGQRADAMLRQARAVESGQITQRFSSAINQIGDDSLFMRIGGIKSLERVALDNQEDVRAVVDTLSTYIRDETSTKKKTKPDDDIVAAVYALSRITKRHTDYIKKEEDIQPDLRGACLQGIKEDIESLSFRGWNLSKIDFQNAFLPEADFQESILLEADFQGASLQAAKFKEAYIERADFKDVDGLESTQLEQAFYFVNPPENLPTGVKQPSKRED